MLSFYRNLFLLLNILFQSNSREVEDKQTRLSRNQYSETKDSSVQDVVHRWSAVANGQPERSSGSQNGRHWSVSADSHAEHVMQRYAQPLLDGHSYIRHTYISGEDEESIPLVKTKLRYKRQTQETPQKTSTCDQNEKEDPFMPYLVSIRLTANISKQAVSDRVFKLDIQDRLAMLLESAYNMTDHHHPEDFDIVKIGTLSGKIFGNLPDNVIHHNQIEIWIYMIDREDDIKRLNKRSADESYVDIVFLALIEGHLQTIHQLQSALSSVRTGEIEEILGHPIIHLISYRDSLEEDEAGALLTNLNFANPFFSVTSVCCNIAVVAGIVIFLTTLTTVLYFLTTWNRRGYTKYRVKSALSMSLVDEKNRLLKENGDLRRQLNACRRGEKGGLGETASDLSLEHALMKMTNRPKGYSKSADGRTDIYYGPPPPGTGQPGALIKYDSKQGQTSMVGIASADGLRIDGHSYSVEGTDGYRTKGSLRGDEDIVDVGVFRNKRTVQLKANKEGVFKATQTGSELKTLREYELEIEDLRRSLIAAERYIIKIKGVEGLAVARKVSGMDVPGYRTRIENRMSHYSIQEDTDNEDYQIVQSSRRHDVYYRTTDRAGHEETDPDSVTSRRARRATHSEPRRAIRGEQRAQSDPRYKAYEVHPEERTSRDYILDHSHAIGTNGETQSLRYELIQRQPENIRYANRRARSMSMTSRTIHPSEVTIGATKTRMEGPLISDHHIGKRRKSRHRSYDSKGSLLDAFELYPVTVRDGVQPDSHTIIYQTARINPEATHVDNRDWRRYQESTPKRRASQVRQEVYVDRRDIPYAMPKSESRGRIEVYERRKDVRRGAIYDRFEGDKYEERDASQIYATRGSEMREHKNLVKPARAYESPERHYTLVHERPAAPKAAMVDEYSIAQTQHKTVEMGPIPRNANESYERQVEIHGQIPQKRTMEQRIAPHPQTEQENIYVGTANRYDQKQTPDAQRAEHQVQSEQVIQSHVVEGYQTDATRQQTTVVFTEHPQQGEKEIYQGERRIVDDQPKHLSRQVNLQLVEDPYQEEVYGNRASFGRILTEDLQQVSANRQDLRPKKAADSVIHAEITRPGQAQKPDASSSVRHTKQQDEQRLLSNNIQGKGNEQVASQTIMMKTDKGKQPVNQPIIQARRQEVQQSTITEPPTVTQHTNQAAQVQHLKRVQTDRQSHQQVPQQNVQNVERQTSASPKRQEGKTMTYSQQTNASQPQRAAGQQIVNTTVFTHKTPEKVPMPASSVQQQVANKPQLVQDQTRNVETKGVEQINVTMQHQIPKTPQRVSRTEIRKADQPNITKQEQTSVPVTTPGDQQTTQNKSSAPQNQKANVPTNTSSSRRVSQTRQQVKQDPTVMVNQQETKLQPKPQQPASPTSGTTTQEANDETQTIMRTRREIITKESIHEVVQKVPSSRQAKQDSSSRQRTVVNVEKKESLKDHVNAVIAEQKSIIQNNSKESAPKFSSQNSKHRASVAEGIPDLGSLMAFQEEVQFSNQMSVTWDTSVLKGKARFKAIAKKVMHASSASKKMKQAANLILAALDPLLKSTGYVIMDEKQKSVPPKRGPTEWLGDLRSEKYRNEIKKIYSAQGYRSHVRSDDILKQFRKGHKPYTISTKLGVSQKDIMISVIHRYMLKGDLDVDHILKFIGGTKHEVHRVKMHTELFNVDGVSSIQAAMPGQFINSFVIQFALAMMYRGSA